MLQCKTLGTSDCVTIGGCFLVSLVEFDFTP